MSLSDSSSATSPEADGIYVREGTVEEVFSLIPHIPEFNGSYPREEYNLRLSHTPHLILLAEWRDHIRNEARNNEGSLAGFKVGYELQPGVFYSWMGGVHHRYRRMGVAAMLADRQEEWAIQAGYNTLRLKTWNRHKGMLCFSILRGFNILSVEPYPRMDDYRIILEKSLSPKHT
ncbi:GNAT family N-acetyltransferase [Roseivirga sp. BDSF3-8]|uniref:GNAT family N-acetyltransferase n=1 Tax=Roseivirga sp. BDSF3-8 TaxID=3241598 RepID=UPI003531A032